MGTSNGGQTFIKESSEKAEKIGEQRKNLENIIIKEEINKRHELEKFGKKEKEKDEKKKFELNIIIYSNEFINKQLKNSLQNYNKEVFDWKINEFLGFSEENSRKIIKICENDFREKKFKNIIIFPIKSFSNFISNMKGKGKDFLSLFNNLNEEMQPFFLFIDEDESDFTEKKIVKNKQDVKVEEKDKFFQYLFFIEQIIIKITNFKKLEKDFELKVEFDINEDSQINLLHEYILKNKSNGINFNVFINNKLFYKRLFDTENINIENKDIFQEKLIKEKMTKNSLKIILQLYNVNTNELFYYYKRFGIEEVIFSYYEFKKEKIKALLSDKKYEYIDKRNFDIIRAKNSPINNLLKYMGYYNQLGDFILYDHINYNIAKINIAIGGFIGSGKSTLINTILGEKRSLEGKGGSVTNYISQYCLKNAPINLIDFPGFRAKSHGKNNTTLFIEEIKSKISDLKKINEVIHCFLFCINYWQRSFDEKDEETKEIFDAIAQLKIRTFFIITESEKKESRGFQELRKIIVNNLEKIKKNYDEDVFTKIFGNNLEENIIPILSKDKEYHGNIAEAFGLDELFKKLYEYFIPRKIDYEKKLYFDESKLNVFIENNELLRIFESKRKLSDDLNIKAKVEIDKALLKLFLKSPKYIYNFNEQSLYEIMKEMIEHGFNLFIDFIDQNDNLDKFKILKMLENFDDKEMIKIIINDETLNFIENNIKKNKVIDGINSKIPWYLKVVFPILSPIYYLVGIPLIKIFSGKIADFILKEVIKLDEFFYDMYLRRIVYDLNNAIDNLNFIRKDFEMFYAEKRFEKTLLKIFTEEEVSSNYLNDLKKVSAELMIKGIDIFDKMKEVHDINIGNISLDQEQEIIYKNIKNVSLMLKNIVENKIETKNIKEFIKQFREKYGITKKDMSDDILEELLKKNGFNEKQSIREVLNRLNH